MTKLKKKHSKYWKYRYEIFIALVLIIIIHLPLFASTFQGYPIDSKNASEFGSFIGGYFGAIFSLFSIVLLYITLREQIRSTQLDQFENRLYEMIRLHRQNVSEFEINENIKDKKVFVAMMKEFRAAKEIVLEVCYKDTPLVPEVKHNLFSISYLILFFGVGNNSNRMLENLLQYYIVDKTKKKLLLKRLKNKKSIFCNFFNKYNYTYFDGHQLRLGHYYRHLFQTVDYISTNKLLEFDEKMKYAKMLRAQLSTYEQALFFINSISPLGLNWWRKGYIGNYKIVKNIPSDFFSDNEIDLKSYFPKPGSYLTDDKCDHESTYFEFDTYGMDDDYVFPNGCVTNMKSTSTKNHND